MLKKTCVINLKVTHSPEILSWTVFLHERANIWQTSNHFRIVLFLLKLPISSMIYRGYLYWSPCVCFCSLNILKNWLIYIKFIRKTNDLVIFWQLKERKRKKRVTYSFMFFFISLSVGFERRCFKNAQDFLLHIDMITLRKMINKLFSEG